MNEDAQKIEQIYGEYLWNTISIRDTAVAKEKKKISTMEFCWDSWVTSQTGLSNRMLSRESAIVTYLWKLPTNRTGNCNRTQVR